MGTRTGDYKIQIKRTQKSISNPVIQDAYLEFGEPFYMDNEDYLVVGPYSADPSTNNLIPNLKVLKAVDREATDVDDLTSTIPVADNAVYYKNNSSTIVTLMDSETTSMYPRTRTEAVTDEYGVTVAELASGKLDIDSASVKRPTVGYDTHGVYISEEIIDTSILSPDLLSIINNKVSIDADSNPNFNPLSLGQDLIGIFIRINDGYSNETDFIQTYIDNRVSLSIQELMSSMQGR